MHTSARQSPSAFPEPSVMTQIPNELNPVTACGFDHQIHGLEVERAWRWSDQMPANRLARGANPHAEQIGVVIVDEPVVLGGVDHVEPNALAVHVTCGFEPSHPEG